MQSKATSVRDYITALPDDRRGAIEAVRDVILQNLDKDYEEGMAYGMIGYYVPHRIYPKGYHPDPRQGLPFAALASQKNYMSLYLMGLYCGCVEGVSETALVRWFREAWARSGKELEMGKSCIRFKRLDDLPLAVIGEAIRRTPAKAYIDLYEKTRNPRKSRRG
ncbi:MAG: DUF1801 domain-containing protein [Acidobacteriota bacterium]|nr:DUF1801 domain-containing protein [Acidobacteriota bacterium]